MICPVEASLELATSKASCPATKVKMPLPAIVTMHEFGLSGPSKMPAMLWLAFAVTVKAVVDDAVPLFVAPTPTAKTAASPSVHATGAFVPWSAGRPEAPAPFLAHTVDSQL